MQHKPEARQAGKAIDAYVRFRAAQEGQAYDLTPQIFREMHFTRDRRLLWCHLCRWQVDR